MNQDDYQPTEQASQVPGWFAGTKSTATPPPKRKRVPVLVIIIATITLLGISAVIGLLMFTKESTCLNLADYREITGTTLTDDLSPTDNFYTDYVLFKDQSADYDNSNEGGQRGDHLVQRVADFYKNHPTKPMVITISGVYFGPETELLTNQRIATVESSLVRAGVPGGIVVVAAASYISPENDGSGDTGEITIAITSDQSCK